LGAPVRPAAPNQVAVRPAPPHLSSDLNGLLCKLGDEIHCRDQIHPAECLASRDGLWLALAAVQNWYNWPWALRAARSIIGYTGGTPGPVPADIAGA
jgi:hypothetical protein